MSDVALWAIYDDVKGESYIQQSLRLVAHKGLNTWA